MNYILELYRPEYDLPEVLKFAASCHTEAANLAYSMLRAERARILSTRVETKSEKKDLLFAASYLHINFWSVQDG